MKSENPSSPIHTMGGSPQVQAETQLTRMTPTELMRLREKKRRERSMQQPVVDMNQQQEILREFEMGMKWFPVLVNPQLVYNVGSLISNVESRHSHLTLVLFFYCAGLERFLTRSLKIQWFLARVLNFRFFFNSFAFFFYFRFSFLELLFVSDATGFWMIFFSAI